MKFKIIGCIAAAFVVLAAVGTIVITRGLQELDDMSNGMVLN